MSGKRGPIAGSGSAPVSGDRPVRLRWSLISTGWPTAEPGPEAAGGVGEHHRACTRRGPRCARRGRHRPGRVPRRRAPARARPAPRRATDATERSSPSWPSTWGTAESRELGGRDDPVRRDRWHRPPAASRNRGSRPRRGDRHRCARPGSERRPPAAADASGRGHDSWASDWPGRAPVWPITADAAIDPSRPHSASGEPLAEAVEHAGGVEVAGAGGVDHLGPGWAGDLDDLVRG